MPDTSQLPTPSGPPLQLGTKTRWGKIAAVGFIGGERYYWMIDRYGTVAMMPADAVEPRDA